MLTIWGQHKLHNFPGVFITDFYMKLKFSIPPGLTNYLDNFLFITISLILCNEAVGLFLDICNKIGCPISMEKTEYADCIIVFLGVLLNGKEHFISIPLEKIIKATNLLLWAINKRKVKIKFIQQITGTLNFLQKAIVPGRAFTRCMYSKLKLMDAKNRPLKQHHHV